MAGQGKGWHGNSAGHAAAGRLGGQVSGGNFKNDREKAAAAGRASGGNFKNNREKAVAAGRRGGKVSSRAAMVQAVEKV
jgi:general stress protein YciG